MAWTLTIILEMIRRRAARIADRMTRVALLAALPAVTAAGPARADDFSMDQLKSLWALPFERPWRDAQGQDAIRVRIYPHPRQSADMRAAEPMDRVVLEGACQLFRGKVDAVGSTGKKLGTVKAGTVARFDVKLAKLSAPLWLECTGTTFLRRGPALISHEYPANFYIHRIADPQPYIEVIAVLQLESYLRGVVPTEVIPSWPEAALRAQAIAARSYAYFAIASNRRFPNPKIYDVDDTNSFQAFSGLTNAHPRTDAAIAATAGQILTFDKKLFPTFFDTDAGGHTESAQEVFGLAAPYCIAQPEPAPVTKAVKPWSLTLELADIAKGLAGAIPSGRHIKSISVASADRTMSQRVREVTLALDDGKSTKIPVAAFRRAAPGVKSALFTIAPAAHSVRIDGKGAGHGVGLDQTGAKNLAADGWSHERILSFYFKGATLCTAGSANSPTPPRC
jgi:SpoIID/LytB domain protein